MVNSSGKVAQNVILLLDLSSRDHITYVWGVLASVANIFQIKVFLAQIGKLSMIFPMDAIWLHKVMKIYEFSHVDQANLGLA